MMASGVQTGWPRDAGFSTVMRDVPLALADSSCLKTLLGSTLLVYFLQHMSGPTNVEHAVRGH